MVCDLKLFQKVGSLAANRTCNCRYLRLLPVKEQQRRVEGLGSLCSRSVQRFHVVLEVWDR
jgi:hypothetical protein